MREDGIEPPDWAKPVLVEIGDMAFWRAYEDLSSEPRSASGRIPWSAIDRYAERYGLDLGTLQRVINRLEHHVREQLKEVGGGA